MNKRLPKLTILLFFLLVTPLTMADMGPKPWSDYEVIYKIAPIPELLDSKFVECKDSQCFDSRPLQDWDSSQFGCTQIECESWALGYGDFYYIILIFDDGIERQSNIFTKENFYSEYTITVYQDKLVVMEIGGRPDQLTPFIYCIGIFFVILIVVFIVVYIRKAIEYWRPTSD
jgi:hypothetical protein